MKTTLLFVLLFLFTSHSQAQIPGTSETALRRLPPTSKTAVTSSATRTAKSRAARPGGGSIPEPGEIAQDQQRLRENIKALTETAQAKQLIARYVSKADEQETRLEQIEKERRAFTDEHARLQAELDAAIRNLSLDRKLN